MTWFKYSCYDECFTYFYLDVTLDECPSGLLLLDMWDLIFIFIWWECMCKYIKLLSEAIINVRLKWKMELFSVWIIIKHRMCNVLNTLVALFIWKGVKCCSVMVKLYLIWISKKKKKKLKVTGKILLLLGQRTQYIFDQNHNHCAICRRINCANTAALLTFWLFTWSVLSCCMQPSHGWRNLTNLTKLVPQS